MVERRFMCLALAAYPIGMTLAAAPFQQQQQEFAIVGGTVFRDSGMSLPEALVTLEPASGAVEAAAPKSKKSKVRKLTAVSSPRGEFTFRVPPVAMKYRVTVSAKGYQSAEKIVETGGGSERVDATFTLAPESKH